MQRFDLSGRVAIVTGGNGGIGLGMARGLAQAGAAVVVAARNGDKSAQAVAELQAQGARALAVEVDVTARPPCRALVQTTLAELGRLDILVNNAGINVRKQPQEYALAEWHRILETNLTSAFMCCQAAYPRAEVAAGGGKIINIGSMMSIFGASFTARLRRDQGRHRPAHPRARLRLGRGQHPGQRGAAGLDRHRPHGPGARATSPVCTSACCARTPAGRWGHPDDFAGIAVFLASPASDFVTGTAIPVDGGYSVQG